MQTILAESAESIPNISTPPVQAPGLIRQTSFMGILSRCPKMQKIFAVVEKVAGTRSTVLLLGESGTGKELVANAIHKLSARKGRIVPVNCAAIPEEILESEMFGHERGSFTGATNARIGRFQLADGGTIFLDEIGEMSPKLQVKLLRVLQEKVIEPVGSTKSIALDVRIIAATNKDLAVEVRAGRFREDLFYRLQVVPIELPPLRERGLDEVELLARCFLARECSEIGRELLEFAPGALEELRRFEWPGNVRQLENVIQRLVILTENRVIDASDLPDMVRGGRTVHAMNDIAGDLPDDGLDFNELVDQFELRLITMALQRTNWNKKAAAKLLRLNRTTLVEKIKKKGLERGTRGEVLDAEVRPEFLD